MTTQLPKIVVLDDYESAAQQMADWSILDGRAVVTVFCDHLADLATVIARLQPFDEVCVMRERTPPATRCASCAAAVAFDRFYQRAQCLDRSRCRAGTRHHRMQYRGRGEQYSRTNRLSTDLTGVFSCQVSIPW